MLLASTAVIKLGQANQSTQESRKTRRSLKKVAYKGGLLFTRDDAPPLRMKRKEANVKRVKV